MKRILSRFWLTMTLLVLTILFIIVLFQIVFLEDYYEITRGKSLESVGQHIASMIEENKLEDMTTDISVENLITQEITEEIELITSRMSAYVGIVDSEMNLYYSSAPMPGPIPDLWRKPHNRVNRNIVFTLLKELQSGEQFTHIMGKDLSKIELGIIITGIPIDIDDRNIYVLLFSPLHSIKETTRLLKSQLVIIGIISLGVASIISLILAKRFSKPVEKITLAAQRISKGKFNTKVYVKSKDEIGDLAHTINDMAYQLGQTEKMRREFISNTSHELKTPISAIRANAELLQSVGNEDLEGKDKFLQSIVDESVRLNVMVEDILKLSYLESGQNKLKKEKIDCVALIKDVCDNLKVIADSKTIDMLVDSEMEEVYIEADPKMFYQALYNIVSNAIQHSFDNKNVVVKVEKGEQIRIEIKDEGTGIPKEDLPYIWDRFYKVDKSRTRDDSGTGLGMAIVKNILEMHDFEYGIESELGKGTRVFIII